MVGWCRGFDTALAPSSLAGLKPGAQGGGRAGGREEASTHKTAPLIGPVHYSQTGRAPGENWRKAGSILVCLGHV